MANSKRAGSGTKRSLASRLAPWLIVIAVLAIGVGIWANRGWIGGNADIATSYAARVTCSCRFVAGRSLDDCSKDKLAGMELVSLSEDVEAQSVTANFPFVTANTARLREGYGGVLDEWED